eukprot:TRINITY_DN12851_c0_g1_i5.p1 TRINITY_DN12851_c0_g1~~TRINITY_DN12851_c0_g1_i5.p1  ORF type:complete len:267 (-),score=70.65 TRINITY_DN12851_c0_g1_i5:30-716(-)
MDITGKSDTVSSSSQKVNEDEFVPSETGSKIGVGEVGEKSGEWKENILERAASAFKKEEDIMQLVYGSSLKEKKKKTKIKKKDKSTLDLFGEGDDDEKGNEDEKDESDAEDFFKIRKPVASESNEIDTCRFIPRIDQIESLQEEEVKAALKNRFVTGTWNEDDAKLDQEEKELLGEAGDSEDSKALSATDAIMKMGDDDMDMGGMNGKEIGRAVQQECRDRSRMPSSA